jgi:hypothetical protein
VVSAKEMIERQPYLPRFTAGGEGNPLGARALYFGNTEIRVQAPINRRPCSAAPKIRRAMPVCASIICC